MNYIDHKLSNIVLPKTADPLGGWDLYIKPDEESLCLPTERGVSLSGINDFFTYFNACSLAKWKRYTGINRVHLHLELAGEAINKDYSCMIQFYGRSHRDTLAFVIGSGQRLNASQATVLDDGTLAFDLLIPDTTYEVIGFTLSVRGEVELTEGYYYTRVAEEHVNPVKLALATTTFQKESYIIPNIELVKAEVLGSEDPIADNFHMFVVDNGRTLDAEALSDTGVTVVPNANVGGSGGFARGMIEALESETEFTHVVLMDDDVSISTESLKRTFNLLSLASGKYKDAFINGAMLIAQEPNRQFEDVSHVLKSGKYIGIKPDRMYMDEQDQIVRNEHINVEVENAYGAWWFSCIPVSAIRKNGLPLPFFVRGDDVEYGVRAHATYMTMNGICVWHDGFTGRFRASVDHYQYARNLLIMFAVTDTASQDFFIRRLERGANLQLRAMSYDAADLLLDGIEDYLKGPDWFAAQNGEEVIKTNAQKNEKLYPLEELDPQYRNVPYDPKILGDYSLFRVPLKFVRTLPYDRHLLPDALLRDTPEVVFYSGISTFSPNTAATRTLVAMDKDGQHATVRHMDRARYRQIKNRMKRLRREMKTRGPQVKRAYKDAMPYLTSVEFWKEHLGLSGRSDSTDE